MTRECQICGRRLRTGIKYCYECRGVRGTLIKTRRKNNMDILIVFIFSVVFSVFITEKLFDGFGSNLISGNPSPSSFSIIIFLILLVGLIFLFAKLFKVKVKRD